MNMTTKLKSIICSLSVIFFISGCADHPVSQLHVVSNYLATEENVVKGIRTPATTFSSKDVIIYFVDLRWDNAAEGFGGHDVTWNWYEGDKLVSTAHQGAGFDHTPFELSSAKSASSLGAGHFKAEVLVDKISVASKEFDINP